MGLYDDRLASLSESRSSRGARSPARSKRVQSLLFQRDAGWTSGKAREWAKAHGYAHAQAYVTEQHVRIRQFDSPETIHRTVPFGRGIRAVVTHEGNTSMASPRTVNASRRRKKTSRRKAPKRKRTAAAAPKRRRRRLKAKAAEAPRKRRATKRTRKVRRKRRVTRASEAWRGNSAGHSKAAKKGHKRRKARKSAPKRRRSRRRKVSEASTVVQAPRKRRRSRRRKSSMVMAPRRRSSKRRSRSMRAFTGGGMSIGSLVLTGVSGGVGFVLADGLDRLLATYDPAATERPKDKFTSDGAGTLANTLNISSRPGLARAGAAIGVVAVPAVGAMFVKNRYAKTVLTAAAFGAGINGFKLLFNTVVMPMLRPKDATPAELQKSYVARLYPSEVAAAINGAKKNSDGTERAPQLAVSAGGAAGALSGPGDVGPFAGLAGDPAYPSAAQVLNRGVAGPGAEWPTAQQTLGTGEQYPSAAQALYRKTGQVGWEPGEASTVGPGPQPADESCGCAGPYDMFLGSAEEKH